MRLENVMVLWNGWMSGPKSKAEINVAVVDHGANNRHLNFLRKSMGACNQGWRIAPPDKQAAHLTVLFTQIVGRDGVPQEQAHAEFMKIAEYREWIEKGTGPFSDAYWAWSSAA